MMKACQNLEMLRQLKQHGLSERLLQSCGVEELRAGCKRLEQMKIAIENSRCTVIQTLLMKEAAFAPWYETLRHLELSENVIEALLNAAQKLQLPLWQMKPETVAAINRLPLTSPFLKLDYYKLFGPEGLNPETNGALINNYALYSNLCNQRTIVLTPAEQAMLRYPFLSAYVRPVYQEWCAALSALLANPDLVQTLSLLHAAHAQMSLDQDEWNLLQAMPQAAFPLMRELVPLLCAVSCDCGRFFKLWLKNGMSAHELQLLIRMLPSMQSEKAIAIFHSHLAYIDALYGKDLEGLQLSQADDRRADVLIYAIVHRQHSFLRMIREHFDALLALPVNALIFQRAFYTRIRLNSLTLANLRECTKNKTSGYRLNALAPGMYTFQELLTLADAPDPYIKLYNLLTIPRVDDKLTVIRQLLRHQLLPAHLSNDELRELAEHLTKKPLDRWMHEDFARIDRLSREKAVLLLCRLSTLERFVFSFRYADDVEYAIRNSEALAGVPTWEQVQKSMLTLDQDWLALRKELDFSDDFLKAHRKGALRFVSREGAGMVIQYLHDLPDSHKDAMRRIVQAEIMGRFREMKYHQNDLALELTYPVSNVQIDAWRENLSIVTEIFEVREEDGFYETLQVGEVPVRTCLSYRDGMYKKCLLAGFDANKKVLYAYRQGVPVARAFLRLTKGCASEKVTRRDHATLHFVDLTRDDAHTHIEEEELVLFLEKSYSSGLSDQEMETLSKLFVQLTREKAAQLGARLVVCPKTVRKRPQGFVSICYSLYISRSKAGAQYLDSLEGENRVTDEGRYRSGLFYVLE